MAIFKVWAVDSDYDEHSARSFDGIDHEDAAQNWANWYDAYYANYLIVGGQEAEVFVLGAHDESAIKVTVIGETIRVYSGRKNN